MSIRSSSVQIKTPSGSCYHVSPQKSAKEKAKQEQRALNPNRAPGDNRGWQVTKSGGMPCWQLVEGGQYRIFVDRNLVPE
jgi:hypothetical protein